MTRIIFASVSFASLALGTLPVAADYQEAPWCAVRGIGKGVYWDCQYYSFEQCRSVVLAGNRGWCNPSPYATPGTEEPKRKPRKSRDS